MPNKLAGTWYRQFEGGVVAATFNDDELKMCATLNADGTLIHLTFIADYTLTKDGLVHGAISGVDWDIKRPGVTEPKQPFPTPPDHIKIADYPLVFKDGPKKGKESVVAVFVSIAPGIGPVFAGSEGKLASEIAEKLPQMAKESKQKVVVLEPALVNKFKLNDPNWKQMHPSEWGKKLGADFVLDIHLEKMSLYQPGSLNQLYEGQADVTADVYDVDAEPLQVNSDEPKYNYVHPFKYPHTGAFDAGTIPQNRFKQDYLEHLAAELAMKHIDHKQGSAIVDEPPSETPPSLPIDLSDADVISAFHALVDCPFSFRTRSTSAGLMVSNIKLAADDDSYIKTAKLFGGMYTFCKDGNIPTPKPAKSTTNRGGTTLPIPRYLEHYPQYFPTDPTHPLPGKLCDLEDPDGKARRAGLYTTNTPQPMTSAPTNVTQSPQPRCVQQTPPDIAQTVQSQPLTTTPIQQTVGNAPVYILPPVTSLPTAVAKPGIVGTWYREFGSKLQIIKITPDYLTMTVIMSGEVEDGKIATATCVTTADYHITRDGMTIIGLITGLDAQIDSGVPEDDVKRLGEMLEKDRKTKEDRPFALTFRVYGDSLVIRNVRMPEAQDSDEDNPLQTAFGGTYKNAGDKPLPKPKVVKASASSSDLSGTSTLPAPPVSPSNTTPPSSPPIPTPFYSIPRMVEPTAPVPTMPTPTPPASETPFPRE
jgi:hypothetical protein